MGTFNKFMLGMALFLVIDQEGIGNTTLSDAFGHEEDLKKMPIEEPSMESPFSILKGLFGKFSEKMGDFKLEDLGDTLR
ncbi:hypothetical protein [Pleomorphovibrio marinus]|uniref:hypothetical protein n=1 Tax=Pleomorphovibrio marinus TaxID=2164132 RepID=UPI001300178A|nr:hypothetical protein [Pleomorphovibrio marinus]